MPKTGTVEDNFQVTVYKSKTYEHMPLELGMKRVSLLMKCCKILVVSVMFISFTNVTYSSNNSDVALEHDSLITFHILKPSFKVLLNYFALINSTRLDGS